MNALIAETDIEPVHLLIPHGDYAKGKGHSDDGLSIRIDGQYDGELSLGEGSCIVIGSEAHVKCEHLQADHILVKGRVDGSVTARKSIELFATAKVSGQITYLGAVAVHPGAQMSAYFGNPAFLPSVVPSPTFQST